MGFFDSYPRFLETSKTGTNLNRLNKRHDAIFASAPRLFAGARILDIASHDGRWAFASLKAGASHVVGIEPREYLIASAKENLELYNYDQRQFLFVQGDVFKWLESAREQFDVVLCLGFFYHTYRHAELMSLIKRCKPKALILDTLVHKTEGLLSLFSREAAADEANAVLENSSFAGMTYVASPSPALLRDYLDAYGFSFTEVDWRSLINTDNNVNGVEDYADGRRTTLICRSTE